MHYITYFKSLKDVIETVANATTTSTDDGKTIGFYDGALSEKDKVIDPVVGWLVCIKGDAFGSSFFGPMGVSDAFRNKKIGHSLLSICLENMKKRGDSYCLIKDAGPIEFYERCCNARLV